MVKSILSKPSPNLNLTEQQTKLFQDIILAGNNMADTLRILGKKYSLPNEFQDLADQWSNLMTELALMLLH
jgi:hypothetical protein